MLFSKVDKDSLQVNIETDNYNYERGEEIEITIVVKNNSREGITLDFGTGCQTWYEINDFSNKIKPSTLSTTHVHNLCRRNARMELGAEFGGEAHLFWISHD